MPSQEVSKKVSLLGSWNEDIFSDEIVQIIAARAKTEKGKKVKVTLNEAGLKITRSRFFQESKSTFFPIKDLKTVTCSPEVSQCVLFILSGADRKYKIIAVRCASRADSTLLINNADEIQRSKQTANVELAQRDSGNWTLREKRGRRVTDVWGAYKPNGEVPVVINGSVSNLQEPFWPENGRQGMYASEEYTPDTHRPETQRPETHRPETHRPETHRPETHMPETHRPETQRQEESRPETYRPQTHGSEPRWVVIRRPETHRPESQWQETRRPETHRQETYRPEPQRPEIYRPEPQRPEIYRSEPQRQEIHRPKTYKPEPQIPEPQWQETHRTETHKPEPQRPEPVVIVAPTTTTTYQKSVYTKRQNRGSNSSNKSVRKRIDTNPTPNNYAIETEVTVLQISPDQLRMRPFSDDLKMATTRSRFTDLNGHTDHNKRQDEANNHYVIETEILPYQHSPKLSRKINEEMVVMKPRSGQTTWNGRPESGRRQEDIAHNYVIEAEILQHQPSPTQPGRYPTTSRQNSNEIKRGNTRVVHVAAGDHTQRNKHQDFGRPIMYSGQSIIPQRSVVYATSHRPPIAIQPVIYREPPRPYEARLEPAVVFYRTPYGNHGRSSPQSEIAAEKGKKKSGKYDQRSLRSNTSKNSQSRKKSHFPTTIVRSIEDTYPRRHFLLQPSQIVGYMPRHPGYHVVETKDPRLYPDDGTPI